MRFALSLSILATNHRLNCTIYHAISLEYQGGYCNFGPLLTPVKQGFLGVDTGADRPSGKADKELNWLANGKANVTGA